MSEIKVNNIVDASGGSTAQVNGFTPSISNMAGRNRIINGCMRIDQRNAGSAVTIDGTNATYSIDRWAGADATDGAYTLQQSSIAPAGFKNSLLATITTADSSLGATQRSFIVQYIEGHNIADFDWGTANAKTVTLSFWVRSSLTGTFGAALLNSAEDRSYPFNYTISSANTWEQKSVTILGDTSGTWLTTNGIGVGVHFNLGTGSSYSGTANAWAATRYYTPTGATSVVGTSGATFYITGVQLEEGSVATPFEHRQYGQELALCQRYYEKAVFNNNTYVGASGFALTSGSAYFSYACVVEKRTTPTWISSGGYRGQGLADTGISTSYLATNASNRGVLLLYNATYSGTNGQAVNLQSMTNGAFLEASAEL